jgi:hypothetical protein
MANGGFRAKQNEILVMQVDCDLQHHYQLLAVDLKRTAL